MQRILFLLIVLFSSTANAQAVWNGREYSGRVCSNPSCRMCASIQAQLQRPTVKQSLTVHPSGEYVAVQRQVKRCNGRTCWYETVTEYIYQPRPTKAVPPNPPQSTAGAAASLNLSAVTDLEPTPAKAVGEMLRLLDPPASAKLFDVGCGDGRILIHAAKHYGCTAVGIELNPESAAIARKAAAAEFVAPLVIVFEGDARKYDLQSAQYVTMYLYHELMAEIVPKIASGTKIASYMHKIPGVENTKHELGDHTIYTGVK
jgi:hypothetical protein